jgi:hypothetical protein
MTLKAAIKALHDDANAWHGVATTLGSAQAAANGLTLGEGPLSWASSATGLLDTYEEIRAKAARLLGEGKSNLESLSHTLVKVAKAYETSDENAARRMKGTWDVRE